YLDRALHKQRQKPCQAERNLCVGRQSQPEGQPRIAADEIHPDSRKACHHCTTAKQCQEGPRAATVRRQDRGEFHTSAFARTSSTRRVQPLPNTEKVPSPRRNDSRLSHSRLISCLRSCIETASSVLGPILPSSF